MYTKVDQYEYVNKMCMRKHRLYVAISAEGYYLVVWSEDESISLVLGKLVVTPVDVATRTVGATCVIKTSVQGPQYNVNIAGRGK